MKHDLRAEIEDFIRRFQQEGRFAPMWRPPLLGVATVDAPRFAELRRAASPTHARPGDLLQGARSVLVFFLPFERAVVRSNLSGETASREWALAYLETNRLIVALGAHLRQVIERMGHAAADTPPTHNFDPDRLVSDWSHRHLAVIAGLGRFGLNRMLITRAGCCGRLGSLVTSAELEPDPVRREESCLYFYNGSCAGCVQRCVNGALTSHGFDRHRCYAMCLRNAALHQDLGLADVCGKCLVGVPCSWQDPVAHMDAT